MEMGRNAQLAYQLTNLSSSSSTQQYTKAYYDSRTGHIYSSHPSQSPPPYNAWATYAPQGSQDTGHLYRAQFGRSRRGSSSSGSSTELQQSPGQSQHAQLLQTPPSSARPRQSVSFPSARRIMSSPTPSTVSVSRQGDWTGERHVLTGYEQQVPPPQYQQQQQYTYQQWVSGVSARSSSVRVAQRTLLPDASLFHLGVLIAVFFIFLDVTIGLLIHLGVFPKFNVTALNVTIAAVAWGVAFKERELREVLQRRGQRL